MKLNFADERLLAVTAHPDDAELLCAGTLFRAKEDGAAIGLCVLCNGDRGQPSEPIPDLAAMRAREMAAAAELLGATLYQGGYSDGSLADDDERRNTLIDVLREFRPTLVLAHAANDYHPDHRAASALAEATSWFCASVGHRTMSPPLDRPPALWWMDTVDMLGFEPGFHVDVSGAVSLKEKMLVCHESQLRRGDEGRFAPLLALMKRQMSTRGAQAGVAAAEAFRAHHAFLRARAW